MWLIHYILSHEQTKIEVVILLKSSVGMSNKADSHQGR